MGSAAAQGGINWVQSPVNGHFYARIAPSSHGAAIATANSQLASLVTIRNAAEQSWLINTMLNGQDAWINMSCERTWLNGWPVDYLPASDNPVCIGRAYDICSGACSFANWERCDGIINGSTNCSQYCLATGYCNLGETRYFLSPNGTWYSRHGAGTRYAIIEQPTNDPYSWASLNSPTAPSPRHSAAIAFDSTRERTIYFGGFDGALRNDTWEWTQQNGWAFRISFSTPSARQLSAMAFDAARNQTVLFGGRNATTALGDTWLWNGNNWVQVTSPTAPSARQSHAMAFDSHRGKVVLFGGTTDTTATGNSETWEFDGTTWTQVTTTNAPSGRSGHAMFYDLASRKIVLFGGRTATGASNETWTYDGTNWTRQTLSVSPPARYEMSCAYDNSRPRGVVVGGWDGTNNMDDVWAYLGFNWYKLHVPTRPAARRQAGMTYHKDRLHLVGGFTNTIVWDPWIGSAAPGIRSFGTGCGSPAVSVQGAAGYTPKVGAPLRLEVANVPASAATFMTIGGSKTSVGSFALPLPLDGLGMPGCWLYNDAAFHLALSCTPTGTSTAQFDLTIPAQAFLVGFHLYFQAWVAHPPANSSGILTSNGLDVTVGGF